jgi:hypothetical protein
VAHIGIFSCGEYPLPENASSKAHKNAFFYQTGLISGLCHYSCVGFSQLLSGAVSTLEQNVPNPFSYSAFPSQRQKQ